MKRLIVLLIVIGAFLLFFVCTIRDNKPNNKNKDPVFKATGWTKEQFVEWANRKDVWPIKEHKRWKQYRDNEPNEMGKYENYVYVIMKDANDVPWAPKYWEECYVELPSPYEDLPEPVRKILDCFEQNDVGKTIGEVVPELAKPILLCCFRNGKFVDAVPISVRLLSLSDDKLKFRVAYEPFSPSMVEGIKADDRIVFYTELVPGDKIEFGIRPRSKRFLKKSLKRETDYEK